MAVVLVVAERDPARDILINLLRSRDHRVHVVSDLIAAEAAVGAGAIDLVMVSWALVGPPGVRRLRALGKTPVVAADETRAFTRDLLRLRRRNPSTATSDQVIVGDLRLEQDLRLATLRGSPLRLTSREFDLLAYLANRPGLAIPRAELLREVWPGLARTTTTLDVHICRLRHKLGECATQPVYVHTVHRIGFRMPRKPVPTSPTSRVTTPGRG